MIFKVVWICFERWWMTMNKHQILILLFLMQKMEKGFEFVTKVMGTSSEREAHDSLNAAVSIESTGELLIDATSPMA